MNSSHYVLGLRQTVNNHRSSTISPSSENSPHSPMLEGFPAGNNGHNYNDEGQFSDSKPGGPGYNQYSSQDSLPDSPYSSQSLDSQSASGQGTWSLLALGRSSHRFNP